MNLWNSNSAEIHFDSKWLEIHNSAGQHKAWREWLVWSVLWPLICHKSIAWNSGQYLTSYTDLYVSGYIHIGQFLLASLSNQCRSSGGSHTSLSKSPISLICQVVDKQLCTKMPKNIVSYYILTFLNINLEINIHRRIQGNPHRPQPHSVISISNTSISQLIRPIQEITQWILIPISNQPESTVSDLHHQIYKFRLTHFMLPLYCIWHSYPPNELWDSLMNPQMRLSWQWLMCSVPKCSSTWSA